MELMSLVDNPQAATVRRIAAEAHAQLAASAPVASGHATAVHVTAYAGDSAAATGQLVTAAPVKAAGHLWISPAPFSVKMRLFCLPYAGGVSENVFGRWAQMLPASIQVCPIELPGRGRRAGEEAIGDVKELARALARGLPLADKPYAVFGTCLGAIIGYELVREVERSGCAPLPAVFMPAAVSPPHLYAKVIWRIYTDAARRRFGTGARYWPRMGAVHWWGAAIEVPASADPCSWPAPARRRPRRRAHAGGGDGGAARLARPVAR